MTSSRIKSNYVFSPVKNNTEFIDNRNFMLYPNRFRNNLFFKLFFTAKVLMIISYCFLISPFGKYPNIYSLLYLSTIFSWELWEMILLKRKSIDSQDLNWEHQNRTQKQYSVNYTSRQNLDRVKCKKLLKVRDGPMSGRRVQEMEGT